MASTLNRYKHLAFTFMTCLFVTGCAQIGMLLMKNGKPVSVYTDPFIGWKWVGAYDPIMADGIKKAAGKTNGLGQKIVTPAWSYEHYAKPCPFDQTIANDYQTFIEKERFEYVDDISYFEDGSGQHGIKVKGSKDGSRYSDFLIYDKSNVRIHLYKYVDSHYGS